MKLSKNAGSRSLNEGGGNTEALFSVKFGAKSHNGDVMLTAVLIHCSVFHSTAVFLVVSARHQSRTACHRKIFQRNIHGFLNGKLGKFHF